MKKLIYETLHCLISYSNLTSNSLSNRKFSEQI